MLASGSRTIKLWRVADGALLRTLEGGEGVTSLAFSPDGHTLAAGEFGPNVRLWNVDDGTLVRTLTTPAEFMDLVWSVAYSPDGRTLAGAGQTTIGYSPYSVRGKIWFWDVGDGALTKTYDEETHQTVYSAQFSPDGALFAYGRNDATVVAAFHPFGVQNQPPEIHCPPAQIDTTTGTEVTFTIEGTDQGNITLDVLGLPDGAATDPLLPAVGNGTVSSVFTWTPTAVQVGPHDIVFTVTDEAGAHDECTVRLVVYRCIEDLAARAKDGKVQLTWTHDPEAECYNVYRALGPGVDPSDPANRIAECHVTTYATYLDTSVTNGTTYYYVVGTVVGGVETCVSNEVSCTPTARTRR
jgi:hypothetical protein